MKPLGGHNGLIAYNFAADSANSMHANTFKQHKVKTRYESRAKLFPQDSLLYIESTKNDFFLIQDFQANKAYKCAVPGWSQGKVAHLGWFRLFN
jgi:hypothetical protein